MPLTRSRVEIDGTEYLSVSNMMHFSTLRTHTGEPEMGSFRGEFEIFIDMHDTDATPFDKIKTLFDLANVVTQDKLVDCKVEIFKDESLEECLGSCSFKGWVADLILLNPLPNTSMQSGTGSTDPASTMNSVCKVVLVPVLHTGMAAELTLSN